MISALCRDLGRLMRRWWTVDRIRASPRKGKLFRIQPGELVVIDDLEAEVVARSVVEHTTGCTLCLSCRIPTGIASLQCEVGIDGNLGSIRWDEADESRSLSEDDFEVWPRQRMLKASHSLNEGQL